MVAIHAGRVSPDRLAPDLSGVRMRQAFIGVDVGTSSARAGGFDEKGNLLSTARHPIAIWHEPGDIVEQSSSDIWTACVAAVRLAMTEAGISPDAVTGVGF